MLTNAKKSDKDEMLSDEIDTSQNGSGEVDVNGESGCRSLKHCITSSLNDDTFDVKDETSNVPKLNGDSDANDWLSSSSSDSESEHNSTDHETPFEQPQHLSNESSHCNSTESNVDTNGSLNGSKTLVPLSEAPFTKKVRPLKICFGVKKSVNGLKVKNSKISNDSDSKVHYIERPPRGSDDSDEDNMSEPEPEPEPEYAQYLGLKPSVKFKCSRCGVKNFASMALLNEHMASCDGQTPLTVSTAVPSSSAVNGGDDTSTNLRITRKVFLCSSCGTYYQSYDLYIHMRELHAKQICLVCFSMFSKSQQLGDHLISAHNLKLGEYMNVLQIRNAYKGSFYITCCTCNRLFSEDEPFDQHTCETDFVVAPEPPPPNFVTPPVPENARCSSVTRDDVTDNKLPYSDPSPIATSPLQIDHSSVRLSSPASASSPSPSLPLIALPVDPPEQREESEDDTKQSEPSQDVISEPSSPHEPSQSPLNTFTSPPAQPRDTLVHNESPLSELEPELPQTADDTIAPVEDESEPPPEYTEPLVPVAETRDEVPESAEPVNDRFVPDQPNAPILDASSDDDSIAASLNHQVEPEEPIAETDTVPTIPLEEEKIAQPLPMALMLDETVASLDAQTLIKECVRTSCTSCAYCQNSTLITVNGYQLATHLLTEHRYKPTKNEDDSEQVEQKIRSSLPDLQDVFLSASASNEFDGTFSCFQCSYSTTLLRELSAHNRKSHQMTIFLCCICKCSFIYYSELLCHECPGEYSYDVHSLKYRCCYCPRNHLPSAFRLMIHLRKHHKSCNFCLLKYNDQHELFAHMTKQHKMPHLCYKCNIAYRSRNDINKHLFWKHGTESVLCQRCLQKKWPHTYHFCMPGTTYTCDECNRVFSKAVALTVHRRAHNGEFPFTCESCDQRFISKRLLAAHRRFTHPEECKPEELQIRDTSTAHSDTAQTSKPGQTSDDGGDDVGKTADQRSDDAADSKKRRKKKRKKEKPNEKPLLDELPPLNLSSESDDESGADEDPTSRPALELPPSSPKPSAASSPLPSAEPVLDEATQPPPPLGLPSLAVAETQPDDVALEKKPSNEPTIPVETEIPAVVESDKDAVEESAPIPPKSPSPTKEQLDKEFLEKALNCVLIEHSYCIPESIFHSAGVDLNGSMDDDTAMSAKHHRHEGSLSPAQSQHRHDDSNKTTEDSCCKSASSTTNTPRKRKHAKNKTSSGESSSSSSSDSDSSSSSCGSNCSCGRSNSGCSSSSSAASDCSTTPEKKKPKKSKRERDEEEEKRTQQQREQMFLLDARESDLDTEVSSAGEDFYEERPCYVPPQPAQVSSPQLQQQQRQIDTKTELMSDTNDVQQQRVSYEYDNQQAAAPKTSNKSRKDKKKKKKRIKLSLAGRLPPNCAPLRVLQQQTSSPQPVPNNEFTNPELLRQMTGPPQMQQQYHQYRYANEQSRSNMYPESFNSTNTMMTENCVSNSDGGAGPADDSNSRLSKRKRVKNKFYGYSSSDEAGRDSPATKSAPKKRVLTKKPNQAPKNRQFIGIKLPPLNKRLSVSLPFTPVQYPIPDTPPVPSMNVYRPPQTQAPAPQPISSDAYNPYRNRYSTSEDSDSDENRHKLVINLPNPLKDRSRTNNSSSYKPSPPATTYSDESMSSNSYISSPQQHIEMPTHNAAATAATAAAMRSQQLYRARLGTSSGGIGVATNSPLKNSERLYCYCQCPYDEVSEMIGCDEPNCKIEWFHFECVGIMVPPKGEWYCPSCRRNREKLSRFV